MSNKEVVSLEVKMTQVSNKLFTLLEGFKEKELSLD